jgi:general stress protein 26
MDTIHLLHHDAIAKMRELANRAEVGFFQSSLETIPNHGRPMIVTKVDDEGQLWFFSKGSSHKNAEIRENNKVQIIFARPHASEFLEVYGQAQIIVDEQKIRELWVPALRTWFEKGQEDPDITLICVKALEAYYWDTKHGAAVMLFKGVVNALTGITMNGDIEGKLLVDNV